MQPSEGFRLSPQQKRLWQLQTGQSTAYRTQGVVSIEGPLQAERLLAALQQIVDRNEILRTTFHRRAGMALAVQVIADEATPTLDQHDLSAAPPDQQTARIELLLDQLAEQHRDLGSGSLLRAALARLGPSRHALLLSLPALCADAATIGNLAQELAQSYAATPFADDPTQYADVAELFNELLDSDDTESGRDYWRQQEPGPSVQPALPLETPAADRAYAPQRRSLTLDRAVAAQIEEYARQHNTSAEIVLLACWQSLLARLSAADAIVVGAAYAGRTYEGLDSALGLFARYVPVRCQLDTQASFSAIVQQIGRSAQTIEELQEYFSWDLYSGKAAGKQPGFAFGFDYTRHPAAFSAADLTWTILQQRDWIDRFKLRLSCAAREETLTIDLHFDPASYADADARWLIERFGTLLLAAISNPQAPIAELAIIGPQERQWLISGLNATQHEQPSDLCLHELFAEQAARTPDACAVIDGDQSLSYAELNERANRLAQVLRERGAGPEIAVALCVERSVEMIVGVLGIWKAGAAYLPLDPAYPAERLQFVLGDAQAPILLTQQRLHDRFSAESLRATHIICLDSDWSAIAAASAEQPVPRASADNTAYVIYTSGSTGLPKGVVVQHRSVVNLLAGLDRAIYAEAATPLRVSLNGPLVFDTSVKQLVQLLRGHTLVIVPEELRLDALALSAFLQQQQVDVFDCTPSLLKPLLDADQLGAYPTRFLIGGEAIGDALWQTLAQSEDRQFYNLYGPTECTVDAVISQIDGSTPVPTIGQPIANVEVYLLDREQQLVPFGLPGEICIGGAGVARGYLKRPDLTAERFIPDRFGERSGERLYRTGDLGRYRADGSIEFGGRIDDQVKLRGFRVELGEIESVLLQHPAVQDAAVILRSEESQRLIAYVVPDARTACTVRQLLRLEREGRIERDTVYELPNAMVVAQVNKNETEFLYNEIFTEQAYLRHGITLAADACVFDVGANVGMFALFVGQHSPNATIYAFEPIPPIFEVLRTNAELYNFKIVPLPYGLADSVKDATFTYYAHASTMSGRYVDADEERAVIRSLVLTQEQERSDGARLDPALLDEVIAERLTSERFTCRLTTISEMIRQHALTRIDLLKIDAQKSELDVLMGIAAEDWPKIRQLVLEVHDIEGRVAQVQALLEREGYSVVVEQETAMAGTPLYAMYARRADLAPVPHASPVEPQPTWAAPGRLTGDLRRWLSARLPEYMVPAAFVLLESLPLTTNGKLDRHALPDPDLSRSTSKHSFVAPRTRVEALLAQIWAELLHVERVGINDNFFELGGDSILCIQVVARANKAGLALAPRQLFAHQTIAELAEVVGDAAANDPEQADQEPVSSALPLLPAQQWFFDQEWPDLRAWNQMIGLELRQPIAAAQLEQVLAALVRHHDALRLRFTRTDGGWQQEIAPPSEQIPFTTVDLAELPEAEQTQAIERIAAELNAQLDLGAGMLLRGALIERGSERPDLLLLVTHALAMDGFSRRILAEDLQTACQQILAGKPIQLPAKTTSLKRWAETLVGYAASDELQRERDYWLATATAAAPRLPRDAQDSSAIDAPQTVVLTLDGEETRALLQDVPAAYRTEINDVLLAALALAVEQWTSQPTLALDLRGHGRESIVEHIDLSRTVGWLTGIFPVALDLGGATEPAAALVAVKEQLRRIPNHGIGYGVLRYLGDDPSAQRLRELPRPEISFNYLGQFDQVLPKQAFGLAAKMVDPSSGLWSPGYLLEIQGGVIGGQLRLAWKYSPSQHQRATIERLTQDFRAALHDLIAHCQSPDAGGYTPSDFPLANLNQQALDTILAQVRKTQG